MIAEHHVQALRTLEDIHFRWLVGRRPEPTRAFAKEWAFEHQTLELAEALADDGVDAVVITSPNALHSLQATQALTAGKHVLLEIPIALTLADAQGLAALARQVNRRLMICHSMRFLHAFTYIRRLVDEGRFHMTQFLGNIFIRRRTNITATGNPRSWTDNILWHHGAHLVDLAMWLGNASPAERVSYHSGPDYRQQGTMDMSLTMTLSSGAIATIAQSYFTQGFGIQAMVIGYEDTFLWKNETLYDFQGKVLVPRQSIMDLVDQNAEFVTAVREKRPPAITPEIIMPTMQVLAQAQAITDSAPPTGSHPPNL
jgi:2-hydroxy-4-carboxymuconate semialdehyde hemiacetal dehydrogenase